MNSPQLVLTPAEIGVLKSMMRDANTYDAFVTVLDDRVAQAMHQIIYGSRDDRDYRSGYAAALLHLREALTQAKIKVYSAP